ncbi:hypothetical protein VUR80DRAFT_6412 [Thermomyces stellatus]
MMPLHGNIKGGRCVSVALSWAKLSSSNSGRKAQPRFTSPTAGIVESPEASSLHRCSRRCGGGPSREPSSAPMPQLTCAVKFLVFRQPTASSDGIWLVVMCREGFCGLIGDGFWHVDRCHKPPVTNWWWRRRTMTALGSLLWHVGWRLGGTSPRQRGYESTRGRGSHPPLARALMTRTAPSNLDPLFFKLPLSLVPFFS